MKVLMIHSPASNVVRGGLIVQAEKTASALRTLGVEVVLDTSPVSRALSDFDLCHIVGANMATYHIGRELYRKGVPLVVSPVFFSLHSTFYLRSAIILQSIAAKLVKGVWTEYGFIAELCRWARLILPNTKSEARLICDGFRIPHTRALVVPNGVDERFAHATPDQFRNMYGGERFILYVGQFDSGRKNTPALLRVLEQLPIKAVLIGSAQDAETREAITAAASKNTRLLVIDQLAHDSELLASAYAACDVFVLPSLFETPGIAALEAALAGAKIVITKYGGTADYFAPWADFVDPRSDVSIHAGILRALDKPKNDELQKHVRKNFLWMEVGRITLEAYEKALG